MKILLTTLNSKYIHSNLALKYLYSVVAKSDLDVKVKEFTINNDMNYIFTELLRGGYDYICFSCYIWNIERICKLGRWLKKANPSVKIVLGGPEVSFDRTDFMKENIWVDYIIRGEGEVPFFKFCKALSLGDDVKSASSLTWHTDRGIEESCAEPPMNFDNIPFPYEHMKIEHDRVVYYESSRGCPYKCIYCLSSIEKTIRSLSLERTKRDLRYFLFNDVKQVKFIDRTFNFNKDRAYEIWKYLIENDNGRTNFHFEICADLIDTKHLDLLSKARKGQFQFEIGIQSINPKTLGAVGRNENVYPILYNVEKLVSMKNIHIHLDLIAGLPLEDYKSFRRSFNKVYSLGADNLQLGFLKLLKGTGIREHASEHDYRWRDEAPYEVISNKYMSSTDMIKLKMIEHVLDLYSNRNGFGRSIAYLNSVISKSAFNFYEQLADFYYTNGYQHRSHKKEDLYRILMKFAKSKEDRFEGISDVTKEILTADIKDTMNFDAVKRFYKKGWEI